MKEAAAMARPIAMLMAMAGLSLGAPLSAASMAMSGPVVRTDLGRVRGVTLGRGAAWRGIPFAAPPTGELRWREARPAAPWSDVRDATRFGMDCVQPARDGRTTHAQGEDCLTLTVITPDRAARDLPVLVSVHGGAFFVGSGRYIADKDLSPMVARGIILVSANYRLGRLGFFAHPALRAEAGRGTGNFWLSDQIAALRWVRRNIHAFGGDPARVTILGCSAGGSSVNSLMVAPQARGLFARASIHSGGGLFNATRPLARAESQGLALAARAGIVGEEAAALRALRALDPQSILAADPGPPDFGAIVDGHFLPEPISSAFAAGRQAPVPMIAGSTSNEASIFGLMGFDATVLKDRFGIDMAAIRPVYERQGPLPDAEYLRRVQTDFIFTSAALGMSALAARRAPAWAYHFSYVPQEERGRSPGAPHCADMDYLFGLRDMADPADRHVAETLRNYWSSFIRTGDPHGPGLPRWPRSGPGILSPMLLANNAAPTQDFERERIMLWFRKWQQESGAAILP